MPRSPLSPIGVFNALDFTGTYSSPGYGTAKVSVGGADGKLNAMYNALTATLVPALQPPPPAPVNPDALEFVLNGKYVCCLSSPRRSVLNRSVLLCRRTRSSCRRTAAC